MSRLEILDGDTLPGFLDASPSVLMLAKSDCDACQQWTEQLEEFLSEDTEWAHVRFGKLKLDQRGLADFKKQNPWLADLHDLPYNIVYVDGERKKEFLGSGIDRLVNRMRRVLAADSE